MIATKIALRKTVETLLRMMDEGLMTLGAEGSSSVKSLLEGQVPNLHGFDLWIKPGDASAETIAKYLGALSDLNIAYGGLGITFKNAGSDRGAFKIQAMPNTLGSLETPPYQFDGEE